MNNSIALSGSLTAKRFRPSEYKLQNQARLGWIVGKQLNSLAKTFSKLTGIPTITAELSAKLIRNRQEFDLGVLSYRVVTDVGVGFIVDAWQNSLELETMIYHGVGTDNTAEDAGDTDLGAESTTILSVDSTRATGSKEEGATANIFKSVGTITFDGAGAIVEHGLFSNATVGSGVLFDRSIFAAINVTSSDSVQFTYQATFSSGS